MKNIFIYSGSRNEKSRPNNIAKHFREYINKNYRDIKVEHFSPINQPLLHSKGCKNCFNHGFCPSESLPNDFGAELKQVLGKTDLIIFISPVYSHNVSSDAKIFVDRLSYWGHLFKLLGKPVITVVTAQSNGGNFVEDYLHKVFSFMGATIAGSGVFYNNLNSDPLLKDLEKNISDVIDGSFQCEITFRHEATFQALKNEYLHYPVDHFEYRFWKETGLLESDTLEDFVNEKGIHTLHEGGLSFVKK